MSAITRMIKTLYAWPPGPSRALGYATIATVAVVIIFVDTRWLVALLFWPILWITRAVISLAMRIPQAQQRRDGRYGKS
jgi:hypothetical protein